jgi:protein TonB
MQVKKLEKVDLEKRKIIFLELGIVLALAVCLAAFEWTNEEVSSSNLGNLSITEDFEEEMQNTIQEPPPIKDPVIEEPKKVIEILTIVDNKKKVDDFVFTSELDKKKPLDYKIKFNDFQDTLEDVIEIIPFVKVEQKPTFPGGDEALLKFITEKTVFPEIPKENGVDGKVYVQFVIDVNGKVTNVEIAKGVDPYLDLEAIRVVKMIPDWTPGKQRGKAVPVSFVVPIKFKLY